MSDASESMNASVLSQLSQELAEGVLEADRKAEEACAKSKYSIQDYWICMEFWILRWQHRVADMSGQPRATKGPFAKKVDLLRRDAMATIAARTGSTT